MDLPNQSSASPVTPSSTPALPVDSVASALEATAHESTMASLDPAVKLRQRTAVLEAARIARSTAPDPERPVQRSWRTWFALGGASFALVAAALVLLIRTPAIMPGAVAVTRFENVNRLLVPDRHATDLFSVQTVSAQEKGDQDGLIVTSRVPLTADQVKATIQVTPSVPVEVIALSDTSFKVIPKGTGATGSYRISLPTLVANEDGSRVVKEYSWSLQAQDRLQVVSTLPANAATYVPLDTGIEFTLNHIGLQVASSTIVITPPTAGRVETHGQTIVFVPARPLVAGTLYQATLQGVKTDAGLTLSEVKRVRFETAMSDAQTDQRTKEISFATEFVETTPNKEIQVGVFRGWNSTVNEADFVGYALTIEEAQRLLEARAALPGWSEQARRGFAEYAPLVRQEAFRVRAPIQLVPEAQGFATVSLPPVSSPGFYVVRMNVEGGAERWLFLQVTNIASYISADTNTILVWTVNAATNKPFANVQVQSQEGAATTNEQGTAQVPAPAFLKQSTGMLDDESGVRVLRLTRDQDQALVVLSGSRTMYTFGRDQSALMNTWGYLFVDRPLYRTTDTLHFAGLSLDRATRLPPEELRVRISRSVSFIDIWTGKPKVYQEVAVTADASGHFDGSLSWSALAPGYYSVALMRGEKLVTERTFEVREFVKPAYTIDILPEVTRVYSGAKIPLTIQAHFFDGTPFPGASLRLQVTQGGQERETLPVQLDSQGMARIDYAPAPLKCEPRGSCNMMEQVEFAVRPTTGEEGEIVGTTSVEVYASSIDLRASQRVEQGRAIVTLKAVQRDLRVDQQERSEKAIPQGNLELRGEAIGYYYEAIPQGTYYDFIQKQVKTSYRYERRRDQQPLSFRAITNVQGEAEYAFTMNPAREYYEVSIQGVDSERRPVYALVVISRGWSDLGPGGSEMGNAPRLVPPDAQSNREFDVQDQVTLNYLHGTGTVDLLKTPGLLVFTASRGIKDVRVLATTQVPVTFVPEYVPNAEVYAVTFLNGHFETAQATLLYRKSRKQLTVTATPEQKQVRPGETIRVAVHVEGQNGQSLADTEIAFAAVDQALFALTGPQNEDPLTALYETVPSGLRFLSASHRDAADGYAAGGAEMGGLGLGDRAQTPRRNFKDTANFQVVRLDAQGNAMLSFVAPDNITAWRLTAVATNPDLAVGVGVTDVAVGTRSFVEVVLPPRLLQQDQPLLSVRAFGRELRASSTAIFTVHAPTLGIERVQATGTALVPTYFSLTKPSVGTHTVSVSVRTDAGEDTVERTIMIAPSFFTKHELVTIDAAPGVGLPPVGQAEATLLIASAGRAALLPEVQGIADLDGTRLDTLVARLVAKTLLRDTYQNTVTFPETQQLSSYQSTEPKGGLKLLPYGSSDILLTADVAMTAPDYFDTSLLSASFAQALANASSTRDEQIAALSALASLHQPVVEDLKALAIRTDLTSRQRLWIAQGLLQAGDRETATMIATGLLAQTKRVDSQLFLDLDRIPDEIVQTAELAALAASLNLSEAEALHAYVESMWSQEAFPVLAKVRYLRARLAVLPIQDGKVTWSLGGGKEESMDLKEEPVRSLTLTAAETQQFRIKALSGNVRLMLIRSVVGRPSSVPGVQISRSYERASSTSAFHEGDELRVVLLPKWQTDAREGCYLLRDHLPGGFQPVLRLGTSIHQSYLQDFDPTTGEVSFITCKQPVPLPITYTARVVTRGTYTAEAPVIEHLEYPSIASVGQDERIEIK